MLSPDSVQMLCIDILHLTRQSAVYSISNAVYSFFSSFYWK